MEEIKEKIRSKLNEWLDGEQFKNTFEKFFDDEVDKWLAENGTNDGTLNLDCGGPFWLQSSIDEAEENVLEKMLGYIDNIDFDVLGDCL